MAFALSVPSNDAPTIASDAGTSSAPPTPCTARAAISCAGPGPRAHQTEAAAKTAAPTTKTRRLPSSVGPLHLPHGGPEIRLHRGQGNV
jgi:hypothetical protein